MVAGDILTGGANNGIVEHLGLTKVSGRYEALVVVDGRLHVVCASLNGDQKIETKGIGTDWAATEVLTGQRVKLPEIKSINQINVFQNSLEDKEQLVLISLKYQSPTPLGDGVTLALKISYDGQNNSELQAEADPFVIDYIFHERTKLGNLINGQGVLSANTLNHLSKPRKNDPEELKAWRLRVADYVEKHLGLSNDANLSSSLPYLDVANGEVVLTNPPKSSFGNTHIAIEQEFDPVASQHKVKILGPGVSKEVNGVVRFFTNYRYDNFEMGLLGLNNNVHFVLARENYVHVLELEETNLDPDNYSFVSRYVEDGDERGHFYGLLSDKAAEKTFAYVISVYGNSINIVRKLSVYDSFLDYNQLLARVYSKKEYEKSVLFDNLTGPMPSATAYKQAFKDTRPLLSLSETTGINQPVQVYLRSLRDLNIAPRVSYQEYDNDHARIIQTGLYLPTDDSGGTSFILGELLAKGESSVLASKTLKLPNKEVVKVHVVGLDQSFHNGESGFKLIAIVTPENQNRGRFPLTFIASFSQPFSSLDSLSIFHGGKQSDSAHLILGFDSRIESEETRASRDKSQIIGITFKVYNEEAWRVAANTAITLDDTDHFDAADIAERILISKSGKAYWLQTPQLEQSDPRFRLVDLSANSTSSGRNRQGRLLELNSWAEIRRKKGDSDGEHDLHGSEWLGSWMFHSEPRLREHFAQSYPELAEKKNKDEKKSDSSKKNERKRNGDKTGQLFPGLRDLLESTADPSAPPSKRVLIVSKKMKEKLLDQMLSLLKDNRMRHWSDRFGSALKLFAFDSDKSAQDEVFSNLEAMSQIRFPKLPVLLGDVREIQQAYKGNYRRLESEEEFFAAPDGSLPHILHLFATEGQRILPEHFSPDQVTGQLRTLLIATEDEWSEVRDTMEERWQEASLECFVEDRSFVTLNWRVWPPDTPFTSDEIESLSMRPRSSAEARIIPNLIPIAEKLADRQNKPAHKVLLMPDELVPFVRRVLLSKWLDLDSKGKKKKSPTSIWSHDNPALWLYEFDATTEDDEHAGQHVSQDSLIKQLTSMRLVTEKRSVMLVDLGQVLSSNDNIYTDEDSEGLKITDPADPEAEPQDPHLLYLLETEGHRIKPEEYFEDQIHRRQISMIYLGTPRQWEALKQSTEFEQRFGLLDGLEIEEFELPKFENKLKLLNEIFEKPQIRSLNYQFQLEPDEQKSVTGEEAKNKILRYMVGRVDSLTRQNGEDETSGFLRAYTDLAKAVVQDPVLRKRRVIDIQSIEMVLAKTFNAPLSLRILPKDDPLQRISDVRKAAVEMQRHGYEGPLELKAKFLETVLSQTKVGHGRPIPSSLVVYGNRGTGKTLLFKTFCKMLGLKEYDFNAESNDDAQAIILNFAAIGETKNQLNPESMTVEEAITHLNDFLASPLGYRGFILLDDVHKAKPEDLAEMMTFLQAIFEARNGFARVRAKDSDHLTEIPVRNLTVMMTLNPTQDPIKLKRFASGKTDEELIAASLSSDKYQLDISFLSRWSTFINLSTFPAEAKAPKLLESINEASRSDFNVGGQFVIAARQAVQMIVDKFPDANAREFLSEATSHIVALANQNPRASVSIVIPRHLPMEKDDPPIETGRFEAQGREGTDIAAFIDSRLNAVPLVESLEGKLALLSIIVDTFRTLSYEAFINSVVSEPRFTSKSVFESVIFSPFLHAVSHGLDAGGGLNLRGLQLDPADFGYSNVLGPEKFFQTIEQLSGSEEPVINLSGQISYPTFIDSLQRNDLAMNRTRMHVLVELSSEMQQLLQNYLKQLLQVQSLKDLPEPMGWFASLSTDEPKDAARLLGKELVNRYQRLLAEIESGDLLENMDSDSYPKPTVFDVTRLFTIALDHAISQIHWGTIVNFMTRNIVAATGNIEVGQMAGVQQYFFAGRYSLVRPITHDGFHQIMATSSAYQQMDSGRSKKLEHRFRMTCPSLFLFGE